jgi:type I restriction enzyme M protein
MKKNPSEPATFYGMEENATTIWLAKMNLAVHGLEGNIQKVITYYEDPHKLVGKADFVIANPRPTLMGLTLTKSDAIQGCRMTCPP